MIWTDGSAIENNEGHRRAGAGVFLGVGNERNSSLRVEGPQTNQRAELAAVLHCLEEEQGRIHIRTDSRYVQLGIEVWRHKWRSRAWYKRPMQKEEVEHADLWQRVDNLIGQRDPGEVKITWIKGHALPRHITCGMTTEQDIWANNAVDRLAGLASAAAAA